MCVCVCVSHRIYTNSIATNGYNIMVEVDFAFFGTKQS